jgi:hypothetical protein
MSTHFEFGRPGLGGWHGCIMIDAKTNARLLCTSLHARRVHGHYYIGSQELTVRFEIYISTGRSEVPYSTQLPMLFIAPPSEIGKLE